MERAAGGRVRWAWEEWPSRGVSRVGRGRGGRPRPSGGIRRWIGGKIGSVQEMRSRRGRVQKIVVIFGRGVKGRKGKFGFNKSHMTTDNNVAIGHVITFRTSMT